MRIDGPEKLQMDGLSSKDGQMRGPAQPARAPDVPAAADAAIADPACVLYTPKAAACEDVNLQAVAEALRLLEAGQLDTPQAARQAAENILSMGL